MELNTIYNEPCLDTLKKMPDNFLDCVITSPPYWMLRDYGCEGQWGREATFQQYLEHLWEMMDEVYRVLKSDGSCWINLGDTYGSNKCLLLLPHRFAIGCINRGWKMRNDCIWAKRNGMPESVTDRFSKKHEYFFFMVKSDKYFFDLDIIRDRYSESSVQRLEQNVEGQIGSDRGYGGKKSNGNMKAVGNLERGKNPGSVSDFWNIPTKPYFEKHYASYNDVLLLKPVLAGCPEGGIIYDAFMGTGSTAEVAIRANRKFIGSEISEEYIKICKKRLELFLSQIKLF